MTDVLAHRYAGLVCDLDGVVYAGPQAIPHAVAALNCFRAESGPVVYATNNASRAAGDVAAHLQQLGVDCASRDVVNSSMAGAHLLREHGGVERVLAVGGDGVSLALREAGLTPVTPREHEAGQRVDAVLQGYGARVQASDLAEAAYAIQGGALWVATNTDRTLPTERGQAPGNGSLVNAVRLAVSREPVVAGKPEPVMYGMASDLMGLDTAQALAVGDRLETDIEGAVSGGYDSVLVLTGVHQWADAAAAPPERRPTYVVPDLRGLFEPYDVVDDSTAKELAPGATTARLRGALRRAWDLVDDGTWTPERAHEAFAALTESAEQGRT